MKTPEEELKKEGQVENVEPFLKVVREGAVVCHKTRISIWKDH